VLTWSYLGTYLANSIRQSWRGLSSGLLRRVVWYKLPPTSGQSPWRWRQQAHPKRRQTSTRRNNPEHECDIHIRHRQKLISHQFVSHFARQSPGPSFRHNTKSSRSVRVWRYNMALTLSSSRQNKSSVVRATANYTDGGFSSSMQHAIHVLFLDMTTAHRKLVRATSDLFSLQLYYAFQIPVSQNVPPGHNISRNILSRYFEV
jgi:hypothetical protein